MNIDKRNEYNELQQSYNYMYHKYYDISQKIESCTNLFKIQNYHRDLVAIKRALDVIQDNLNTINVKHNNALYTIFTLDLEKISVIQKHVTLNPSILIDNFNFKKTFGMTNETILMVYLINFIDNFSEKKQQDHLSTKDNSMCEKTWHWFSESEVIKECNNHLQEIIDKIKEKEKENTKDIA